MFSFGEPKSKGELVLDVSSEFGPATVLFWTFICFCKFSPSLPRNISIPEKQGPEKKEVWVVSVLENKEPTYIFCVFELWNPPPDQTQFQNL